MATVLATGKQRSSKSSKVVAGGTTLAFASWKADVTGKDLPTNNFESYNVANAESYEEGILGFIGCDGTFGGDWDAGVNPIDFTGAAGPQLYPRDDLGNGTGGTQLWTSVVDAVWWSFPILRIRGCSVGAEIEGKITFIATYKSQGVFSFPTGNV